ncbi:MAG: hypothetical protein ACPGEG_00300 [Salibacteraceae bacterium]
MNKLEEKKVILEAGRKKMAQVVNDFQERINELKTATGGNDSGETASQSESRVGSDLELLDSLMGQLDFATLELQELDKIDAEKVHSEVDFGSVVITDKRNLFVSTGIEEFQAGKMSVFGLSTKAPLYKNMAGCKPGETVSFNGIEYKIQSVF